MPISATDLNKAYIAYFGRPSDVSGRTSFATKELADVITAFDSSAESKALYGDNVVTKINAIYNNLFNRDAEPAGLVYWVGQVNSGKITPAGVAIAILNGAQNDDAKAVANKLAAADAFTAAIDTTAEIVGYSGNAAVNSAREFLKTVGPTDASLTTAVAGVDAAVLAATNAGAAAQGQTFTLTGSIDTIVGGTGNDTITGSGDNLLTGLDSVDGGSGKDTLNLTGNNSTTVPASVTVKNVEIANVLSGGSVTVDASGWTGLTTLKATGVGAATVAAVGTAAVTVAASNVANNYIDVNGGSSVSVSATDVTSGKITVGSSTKPTDAVSVTSTIKGANTGGDITVSGGTTVSVKQTSANAMATHARVIVNGGDKTTAVTSTATATVAGAGNQGVNVTDVNYASTTKAGTIASVSIDGYNSATINDNALTTLSLANGGGNVIVDNSGLTTATNKTLAVTVNNVTGGTLDDADIYTTLNVTTAGAASTLSNITFGGATALNVAGAKGLTLTSAAGLTALKTVAVSGSAGITADLSGASVTSVDTSGTTGASKVTVDASKATFTGGAGVDTVTVAFATSTKAISLGAGDDSLNLSAVSTTPTGAISGGDGTDNLTMTAALAATASASAAFAGVVTGFETLTLTSATNQTIDLDVLGKFSNVTTSGGNGLTLSNMPTGGTLTLNGAGTAYTIGNSAFTAGTADTINLKLTDGSTKAVDFASTGITASGVEVFNITTADTQATPSGSFMDTVTLLGNSVKTIAVAGNAGLALTATSTALTSVDASGITLGGFAWTSGALAGASVVKGSATGANTVNVSAATGAVTYTGGSGADSITATNGKANVVSLGDGTNSYTATTGNQTVTGGAGADTVAVGNGNNTVSLGNGANSFTATSGNNTYTGGTGVDTVTVGGGMNTLTLGAGADVVTISAAGANVNTYTTIADAAAGDTIGFVDLGVETFKSAKVTLANTAVFQDYANAVIQAGGNASVNGAFGWFQFGGDTYLVESRHDGSGNNASFVNGTDMLIKLTGLIDLSTATGAGTSALTLA